jgi:transposase
VELRMSQKERDRLKVVCQLKEGKLGQEEAAQILGISIRQVRRSLRRFEAEGDAGLTHRLRGRLSNNRIREEVRAKALRLVKRRYSDFGPTLAAKYLAERQRIEVSKETLRGWMVEEGIWQSREARVRHRQWRERRACYGELVQIDTSIHPWFEGRGEEPVLIAMIDDATGRLEARFYLTDSTCTNMAMLRRYLGRHGRPVAVYGDKASHFKTTRRADLEEALAGRAAETQIERALRQLGIRYIAANSPQAKGRVERVFRTLQDRLVKALRVEGISEIDEANRYLEREYLPAWNREFMRPARSSADAHRPLQGLDFRAILSVHTTRAVANDYTARHNGRLYQIDRSEIERGLRGSKVIIEENPEGRLRMKWRGRYLKIREVARAPWQEARTAGAGVGLRPPPAPAEVKKKSCIPSPDHPWRKRTLLPC